MFWQFLQDCTSSANIISLEQIVQNNNCLLPKIIVLIVLSAVALWLLYNALDMFNYSLAYGASLHLHENRELPKNSLL